MNLSKEMIVNDLHKLGLVSGDIVLLHSSLASLGYVEGGGETVVRAFLDVLGDAGTLVLPTFGTKLGIITNIIKEWPNVVSSYPVAAVSAVGAKAKEICAEHWKAESAHGEDTPYLKIAELGGYICMLGVDQDRNTTLHSVEAILKLPYLNDTAEQTFETPEGKITKHWKYFPGPHRDFISLDNLLVKNNIMKVSKIGNSLVRLIKSREMLDFCIKEGQTNPAFVLCDNLACEDCVSQKSKIIEYQLSKEDFSISSSSQLAGYYVEEIIDNLLKNGIKNIELDYIKGKPVYTLKPERIKNIVERINSKGCKVSGIRVNVIDEDIWDSLLETAKECSIKRIIAPLCSLSDKFSEKCLIENIVLSSYNLGISSDYASKLLMSMNKPKFTFNAAEFANIGEKPFLTTYKKKLKKFIDQLDVNDACFDGTLTSLANGNAEIKELISILRCSSFSGNLHLTSENKNTLKNKLEEFSSLLKGM